MEDEGEQEGRYDEEDMFERVDGGVVGHGVSFPTEINYAAAETESQSFG